MDKFFIGEEHLTLENKRVVELKYYVLKQEKFVEETGENKITYGIEVEKCSKPKTEKEIVLDVTTKEENIMRITNCLKENKITPIHLKDVIVDML